MVVDKFVIQITSSDTVEIKEYKDYKTINDLVDGWYEICGYIEKDCLIFCNEEYLLRDDCKFNAIATILCRQDPIYGNTVLMYDGYNDEGERDSLPLSFEEAVAIKRRLDTFVSMNKDIVDVLHYSLDKNKPTIIIETEGVDLE